MQSVTVFNSIRPLGGNVMNFHPGWMQSVIGGCTDSPDEEYFEPLEGARFMVTPAQTAASIFEHVKNPERFNTERPAFLTTYGDRMKW